MKESVDVTEQRTKEIESQGSDYWVLDAGQQSGKKKKQRRQSVHVTRAWEKKMKDLERNHGIGWGKVARVDGVTWATNRAHIGEKEKEERRLPRSRAQCMGLSEETEGLDEEGS